MQGDCQNWGARSKLNAYPIPPTHAGVGCSVIAFVLASRFVDVAVMSTTAPLAWPKNDKSILDLSLNEYDVMMMSTQVEESEVK